MAFTQNNFSADRVHEGSYLVYIAGIETPALGVTVNMGVWTIPTAMISLAPDVELVGLGREDRVPVAIFYLDEVYNDAVDPQFRLLFDGYITGYTYSNSPRGRSINFSCVSDLAIFDELYPFFVTSVDTMVMNAVESLQPNAVPFSFPGMTFPACLLYNGFDPTHGAMKRPYDFIENALRACVAIGRSDRLKSAIATNFYSRFLRKCGMINRWVPSPLIETLSGERGAFPVLKALQGEALINAVANKMQEFSNGSSLWTTFQKIFLMMYYEIIAIPPAPMAQVTLSKEQHAEIVGPPKWVTDPTIAALQAGGMLGTAAALASMSGATASDNPFPDPTKPNRLLQFITKPQWLYGIPPMCNVIFPSMIQSLSFQEDYNAQPTRLGINDEMLVKYTNQVGTTAAIATLRGGYPLQYQQALERKFGSLSSKGDVITSGKNFLIWPEEFFKGPRVSQETLPDWFVFLDDIMKNELKNDAPKLENRRKQLAYMYAQYEYWRQRGATRRGGLDMVFNPYVVPGYTAMIFSDVPSGQNYHVYVTSVSHSLSKGSMQTSIGFTFAQTLDELMHGVLAAKTGQENLKDLLATPMNPITELRDITQLLPQAELYFSKLFHQNQKFEGNPAKLLRTAAFDYRKAIQLVMQQGDTVSLLDETALTEQKWLQKYVAVEPTANYAACFKSTDAALQQVSRPICTLEEYISWHRNGRREGPLGRFDAHQGKGAAFYTKILHYVPGPGEKAPEVDADNNLLTEFEYDLRADWETRLRNYRNKVIFQTHPQEA